MKSPPYSWQKLLDGIATHREQPAISNASYSGTWLLLGIGIGVTLMWDWKLFLATGIGVIAMLLVYLQSQLDWSLPRQHWQQLCDRTNRQFALAAGSSGAAAVFTYAILAVLTETEEPWLGAIAALQCLLLFVLCGLVGWQTFGSDRGDAEFDQHLAQLCSSDPIERLLGIRQFAGLVRTSRLESNDLEQLAACLVLLCDRETETVVREAAIACLQQLDLEPFRHRLHSSPASLALHNSQEKHLPQSEPFGDRVDNNRH